MAEITKLLGIAISDESAGRITKGQLIQIFQESINNGDIREEHNQAYMASHIIPLIDAGVLQPSEHVDAYAQDMDQIAREWLAERSASTTSRVQVEEEDPLPLIQNALDEIEDAIRSHPPELINAYSIKAAQYRSNFDAHPHNNDWMRRFNLNRNQAALIDSYLMAASLMSAWFHLNGDKASRDKSSNTAVGLVSMAGVPPQESSMALASLEIGWRTFLKSSGLAGTRRSGCASSILLFALLGSALVSATA